MLLELDTYQKSPIGLHFSTRTRKQQAAAASYWIRVIAAEGGCRAVCPVHGAWDVLILLVADAELPVPGTGTNAVKGFVSHAIGMVQIDRAGEVVACASVPVPVAGVIALQTRVRCRLQKTR